MKGNTGNLMNLSDFYIVNVFFKCEITYLDLSNNCPVVHFTNLGVASLHQQYLGDLVKMILKEKHQLMRIFIMVTLF